MHRNAGKNAEAEENDLRRAGILANFFHTSGADRLAGDNAHRARKAVHCNVHHVVQHIRDAHRRNDARVITAENHRLPQHVHRPYDLPSHDRQTVAQEIARQFAAAL